MPDLDERPIDASTRNRTPKPLALTLLAWGTDTKYLSLNTGLIFYGSNFNSLLVPGRYPRPTNGIFVAMIVRNCTFASSGRLAM